MATLAEKLQTILTNTPEVYNAGYEAGRNSLPTPQWETIAEAVYDWHLKGTPGEESYEGTYTCISDDYDNVIAGKEPYDHFNLNYNQSVLLRIIFEQPFYNSDLGAIGVSGGLYGFSTLNGLRLTGPDEYSPTREIYKKQYSYIFQYEPTDEEITIFMYGACNATDLEALAKSPARVILQVAKIGEELYTPFEEVE